MESLIRKANRLGFTVEVERPTFMNDPAVLENPSTGLYLSITPEGIISVYPSDGDDLAVWSESEFLKVRKADVPTSAAAPEKKGRFAVEWTSSDGSETDILAAFDARQPAEKMIERMGEFRFGSVKIVDRAPDPEPTADGQVSSYNGRRIVLEISRVRLIVADVKFWTGRTWTDNPDNALTWDDRVRAGRSYRKRTDKDGRTVRLGLADGTPGKEAPLFFVYKTDTDERRLAL